VAGFREGVRTTKDIIMKHLYRVGLWILLLSTLTGCNGQTRANNELQINSSTDKTKLVGGGCDGCELMYVGMPTNIKSVDTSEGWTEKGQKLLVTGIVYKLDGKTPAPNVIIYYWQTDNNGYYSPKDGMDEKARRHGHLRGWVRTDDNGKYSIYTIKPAPYPNENIPAHIHTSIKEPNIQNEYYIDEFIFDDDKLLTSAKRKALENRGGSGILRVLISGDLQIAEHNIILGLNIPNYPDTIKTAKQSGLQVGEDNPSFIPYHAFGPDKGTRACPVCKYGRYHGILFFVGNKPDWDDIKKWLTFLEEESIKRGKYFKAYFVYGNEEKYNKEVRQADLEKIGTELDLKNIALTFVPSLTDTESEVNLNKINPTVESTFVLYRQRAIIQKFIDLKATTENFKLISSTLDQTKSEYFNLLEPDHD
jgi:protocatechuate 3,4-dioxygenase, beta subunit